MPDLSPDGRLALPAQQDTAATEPERAQPAPEPMPQPEPSRMEPAMIDIHPPHHGAMTRREVLTHLAIVVAGILIAIGLEQAVEAVHHARQRRELIEDAQIDPDLSHMSAQQLDDESTLLTKHWAVLRLLRLRVDFFYSAESAVLNGGVSDESALSNMLHRPLTVLPAQPDAVSNPSAKPEHLRGQ